MIPLPIGGGASIEEPIVSPFSMTYHAEGTGTAVFPKSATTLSESAGTATVTIDEGGSSVASTEGGLGNRLGQDLSGGFTTVLTGPFVCPRLGSSTLTLSGDLGELTFTYFNNVTSPFSFPSFVEDQTWRGSIPTPSPSPSAAS